jgi:hypothetical protein
MELELAVSKDWKYGIGKINPKIGSMELEFLNYELNIWNRKNKSRD